MFKYFERRREQEEQYQDLLLDIYEDMCEFLDIEDDMNYDYYQYPLEDLMLHLDIAFIQSSYIRQTGEYQQFKRPKDLFKFVKQYVRKNHD